MSLRAAFRIAAGELQRQRAHAVAVANAPERTMEDPGPEERLDLERALAMLSDQQRACVVLRDVAGLSAPEAAAVLGTTAATVRVQAIRGRHRFASCWRSVMPDRYDDQLEILRNVDVPDQWDDISRRATDEAVNASADLDGGLGHSRWPLLLAAAAVLVLVAGSAAIWLATTKT